jgi:hypothetical protein
MTMRHPRLRPSSPALPLFSLLVLGAAASSAAGASCSAGGDEENPFAQTGTGGGAGTVGGGGTAGIGTGGTIIVDSGGDGIANCFTCSADLKKVLDCNGTFLKECTGGQACGPEGKCVDDACGAANDAKSTYGCDYWALNLDVIKDGKGACYAVFVANTWSTPAKIQVARGGQNFDPAVFARIPKGQGKSLTYGTYDANAGLPPDEVVILFLAQGKPPFPTMVCPPGIQPAVAADTSVAGTGKGQAFHITTNVPVVAYQIFPYGGGPTAATSATLLLPTSAWDLNYIAVNAYKKSQLVAEAMPSLDIVASQDSTKVSISPVVAIQGGGGVQGTAQGKPIDYMLNKGEYLQISQAQELTGSPILADKPVALFGGASCLNVTPSVEACDSAQQQIPPVKALGHQYVGVRYRARKKGGKPVDEVVPWRLVGTVAGTQLSWTPAAPQGAPATLDVGQVAELAATGPFVVKSQDKDHPFYMATYMTGGVNFTGEGDPEWVNVVPAGQFLDNYVFFTDPTYPETNLIFVRKRGQNGPGAEVKLDCAGAVGGWTTVGDFEYALLDTVTGTFQNVGNCSNGRHLAESASPFGLTVWGWGSAATGGLTLSDPS